MGWMNRREFLHESALWSAALAAVSQMKTPVVEAAADKPGDVNGQLRVAVIGVRGRGRDHLTGFAGKHNCIVATVCDCDAAYADTAIKAVEKAQGKAPKFEQDLRKVMDDKSIDIVSIATPNHWHALAAIWAMQAGKDVYVEKPVSHNVSEGRRIVEAARKYNKICQTGTQSRTNAGMRQSIEYVRSGKLGKVTLARGLCYKLRPSIGKVEGEQAVPKTIDYDLWCGPAPKNPLKRKNLHYDWHWTWDYGNGDLGNQGIHEMDKARWGLGKNELPRTVLSLGGRFGYSDDGETANTQLCFFDYGDSQLIFEVRGLPGKDLLGTKVGNIFYGTEGYVVCPSYDTGVVFSPKGAKLETFKGGGDHYANFVKAVRNRKSDDLNADILEGHLSSALCHLGNISYRLGKVEPFSTGTKSFGDNKESFETYQRMQEHLKDNKVGIEDGQVRVGRKLLLNTQAETFVNDKEADAMLTREYRKGFEVPAKL
ncbi:dehydrogenase [Planctomycetaceae bacterium SCGC AG-212-F19]|nr:dehydrogenase [Planctomycetaceae bacterium SCGC AG-212-F19]